MILFKAKKNSRNVLWTTKTLIMNRMVLVATTNPTLTRITTICLQLEAQKKMRMSNVLRRRVAHSSNAFSALKRRSACWRRVAHSSNTFSALKRRNACTRSKLLTSLWWRMIILLQQNMLWQLKMDLPTIQCRLSLLLRLSPLVPNQRRKRLWISLETTTPSSIN